METKTDEKVVLTADYYQVINSTRTPIDEYKGQLVIVFVTGSGYGDQSYWCSFSTKYDVYELTKWGKEMQKVGEINEWSGTDGCGFKGQVKGQEIALEGVTADHVFKKVFHKDS